MEGFSKRAKENLRDEKCSRTDSEGIGEDRRVNWT